MQPHQERVVDERNQLEEKTTKLRTFLDGEFYKTLSAKEQVRLSKQLIHMSGYLEILNERIADF